MADGDYYVDENGDYFIDGDGDYVIVASGVDCCCKAPSFACDFNPIDFPSRWDVVLTNLEDATTGCDSTPEMEATHRLTLDFCQPGGPFNPPNCRWSKRGIAIDDCITDHRILLHATCFTDPSTVVEILVRATSDELFPVLSASWSAQFATSTDFLAMSGQTLPLRNAGEWDDGDCAVTAT